jgi:hypothetical protein
VVEVARGARRVVDLSQASWFDVSGVRPHQGRLPAGVDREPDEADGAGLLVADLVLALAAPQAIVDVAEWDGWGFDREPMTLDEPLTVAGRGYRQQRLPAATAAQLARSTDTQGWPLLAPNLVWTDRWCLAADIDCMSTYVGTAGPQPALRTDLEVVPVSAEARVS